MNLTKINAAAKLPASVICAAIRGEPVRLDFYRDETPSCSEEVVFSDIGIVRQLPTFRTTHIEFTPETAAEFTFTCGMNMMRGKVVVGASSNSKKVRRELTICSDRCP